ncbi:MAG: response regulator [Heyndrickxia sp.]
MFHILLVDDEPLITRGLNALLNWEDYGFEVTCIAENGEEALELLKSNDIQLLVTDILMPKMTGLELIKKAKEIRPELKCVVLSGYQEFDYIKEGLLLGIENYLVKPVDKEELLKTVQTISKKLFTAMESSQSKFTTLKENILSRLLNGEIEKNNWRERLSLYDVEVNHAFYGVSILDFENANQEEVLAAIQQYVEERFSANYLYNSDQEMIIIFGGESDVYITECNRFLVDYLNQERERVGRFYLSLGNTVSSMDELEESYLSARECKPLQIYMEPNVLISGQVYEDRQAILKKEQEWKENFAKELVKSQEELNQMIDQFYCTLTEKAGFLAPSVAKKYTIDFISYIHHSLKPDEFSYHTASIEKLVYATNITQMKEILEEYCRELLLSINHQNKMRSPIVQNVLEYIHANYHQELSLKTFGHRFHVNPIYLGQLFQKEVGVVFSVYINHYRLKKAKELLKTTNYRAGEIGKKVGYSDTTYFYKQFKKSVGVTPTEWRNL